LIGRTGLPGAAGYALAQGSPQENTAPRAPRKKRRPFYGEIPIFGKCLSFKKISAQFRAKNSIPRSPLGFNHPYFSMSYNTDAC